MSRKTTKRKSTRAKVLRAPFPWFGGKSRAAPLIWSAFGDVANYVEPFAGSLAVLLSRPTEPRIETVNDLDAMVANFGRAVQHDPEAVAAAADWPVNEADLHARHRWLVTRKKFRERMHHEAHYFDAKVAGWWVWGICQWIGSGWCSMPEPETDVESPNTRPHLGHGEGVHKDQRDNEKRPHLWRGGVGVHSRGAGVDSQQRPDLSASRGIASGRARNLANASGWDKRPVLGRGGRGVGRTLFEQLPNIRGSRSAAGLGVHASGLSKKMPDISGLHGQSGRGILASGSSRGPLLQWMGELAERLRRVRVCCGDWTRVLGPSSTEKIGTTGILLDPPYSAKSGRDKSLYGCEDLEVAHAVRDWAIEHGDNPRLRIALCGYEGEHEMPSTWRKVAWKAVGGYASSAGNHENAKRERIWLSPHCLDGRGQVEMFPEVS